MRRRTILAALLVAAPFTLAGEPAVADGTIEQSCRGIWIIIGPGRADPCDGLAPADDTIDEGVRRGEEERQKRTRDPQCSTQIFGRDEFVMFDAWAFTGAVTTSCGYAADIAQSVIITPAAGWTGAPAASTGEGACDMCFGLTTFTPGPVVVNEDEFGIACADVTGTVYVNTDVVGPLDTTHCN